MHYVVSFLFENLGQLKHNLWPEDERTEQHIWCETENRSVLEYQLFVYTKNTDVLSTTKFLLLFII